MKKAVFIAAVFVLSIVLSAAIFAVERDRVPRVAYIEPDNDTVVDLTGKTALTFKWKMQPIPGGGRTAFRFKVFKGFTYELVAKEELGRDILSIDVPADKFKDGELYSWEVQQRDGSNFIWSLSLRWSFKVSKKEAGAE